ncbi:hypothetical protein [Niveibacterium sp. SC-1]|uniref:hypothetical protein n=1 Tax=Niveibacterium sp. SC-1 TaxID=3135646 RepID=UPI00311FDE7C
MGTLRALLARHGGWRANGSEAVSASGFVAIDDEEEGITYTLEFSVADITEALALIRAGRGSARLPGLDGRLAMAGDLAYLSVQDGVRQGKAGMRVLTADARQLRTSLAEALRNLQPAPSAAALVLPFVPRS